MAILARPPFLPVRDALAAGEASLTSFSSSALASAAAVGETRTDEKARITALYMEHGKRIHRFLKDLLGDAALAADATQETFVRAYKRLSTTDDAGVDRSAPLAPWLFGIARNVSLEARKARFRAGRHLVAVDGSLPEAASAGPSPESEYLGREAVKVVASALSRLPEERQAMLLLRLDHGLSYDDIAVTMGCSLAKVKVEIFRARETLRATMADYEQS